MDGPQTELVRRRGQRLLHGVALATACALFPLILVGAGVTSQGAGMAYPDWPTSGGHLVNPPHWWQQNDTRWEHGHRLIGWAVGMLSILLAALSWRKGGATRIVAVGTLGAISLQGILGGLRVTEVSHTLAVVHGIWGQICFCLAAVCVLLTSPGWANWRSTSGTRRGIALKRLALAGCTCLFLQLGLGAVLRHFGGDHALIAHVCGAVVVTLLVGWLGGWVMSEHAGEPVLMFLGLAVFLLLLAQLALGGMALPVTILWFAKYTSFQWMIPSAHVGVGALLLACCVLLAVAVSRLVQSSPSQKESMVVAPLVSSP